VERSPQLVGRERERDKEKERERDSSIDPRKGTFVTTEKGVGPIRRTSERKKEREKKREKERKVELESREGSGGTLGLPLTH
jgi:hypothetical protein